LMANLGFTTWTGKSRFIWLSGLPGGKFSCNTALLDRRQEKR